MSALVAASASEKPGVLRGSRKRDCRYGLRCAWDSGKTLLCSRARQALAQISGTAVEHAQPGALLRRERGILPLQLGEDAGQKRLRRRPRIGRTAGVRIGDAVRRLALVDGLGLYA